MRFAVPALDPGLADVRTLLAHRRTSLSTLAGCVLIVRLAALRPLWASIVIDPVVLVVCVLTLAGERFAWRVATADDWTSGPGAQRALRERMVRAMVIRVTLLAALAMLVLVVPVG